MEESTRRSERSLKLERKFEQARLENEFLACAYEHLVPLVRRPTATPRSGAGEDAPQRLQKQNQVLLGG